MSRECPYGESFYRIKTLISSENVSVIENVIRPHFSEDSIPYSPERVSSENLLQVTEDSASDQVTTETVTYDHVTDAPVRALDMTVAQVTTEPATDVELTNESVANVQVTTEQVTTEPASSEHVTNEDVTTEHVTTEYASTVSNEFTTTEATTFFSTLSTTFETTQTTERNVGK